jgi:hypothetical protein
MGGHPPLVYRPEACRQPVACGHPATALLTDAGLGRWIDNRLNANDPSARKGEATCTSGHSLGTDGDGLRTEDV